MALCISAFGKQTGISGRVVDGSGGMIVSARVTLCERAARRFLPASRVFASSRPCARPPIYYSSIPRGSPVETTVPLLLGQSMPLDLTLQTILDRDPNNFDAHTVMAFIEVQFHDYARAERFYSRALELRPSSSVANVLANLLAKSF